MRIEPIERVMLWVGIVWLAVLLVAQVMRGLA